MIYVIESGDYFKVGYTGDKWKERSSAYKTHNPDWELLALLSGDRADETRLHKSLNKFKSTYRKEWFIKFDDWFSILPKIIKGETVDLDSIEFESDECTFGFLNENNNFTVEEYALKKSVTKEEATTILNKDFKNGKCVRLDIYGKNPVFIYYVTSELNLSWNL